MNMSKENSILVMYLLNMFFEIFALLGCQWKDWDSSVYIPNWWCLCSTKVELIFGISSWKGRKKAFCGEPCALWLYDLKSRWGNEIMAMTNLVVNHDLDSNRKSRVFISWLFKYLVFAYSIHNICISVHYIP